jgi:enoyl-CoA hydratase/carnithine racemase
MTDGSPDRAGTVPVVRDEAGVRWITFNRPAVLNALRFEDLAAVVDAVNEVPTDSSAIVLTGAGERAFSAGMHVDTFLTAAPQEGRAVIMRVAECVRSVRLASVPTVAMVNGYCLGAAFELALACDLRVAHPEVRFGLPEVKLGIPSVIEAALLPHYVGLSKAKEIALTGDLYSVADLAAFGLVNRVAPASDLRAEVAALVAGVDGHTPEVVAAQKRLFQTWLDTGLQEGIDASIEVFADVFRLPSTTQAIVSYRERLARRDA